MKTLLATTMIGAVFVLVAFFGFVTIDDKWLRSAWFIVFIYPGVSLVAGAAAIYAGAPTNVMDEPW